MDKVETDKNEVVTNPTSVILLGEYLKEKRTEKKLTLEKMSQKTKIGVNILKALENNDFENLPSAAYIKGFVRSYVKVLGLPLNDVINKMEYTYLNVLGRPFPVLNHTKVMANTNQVTQQPPVQDPVAPFGPLKTRTPFLNGSKSILPIAIFAIVVVSVWGSYSMISTIVKHESKGTLAQDSQTKISSGSLPEKSTKIQTDYPSDSETPSETLSEFSEATQDPSDSPSISDNDAPKAEAAPEDEAPKRNFPPVEFKKIRSKLFTVLTNAPENNDESILSASIKSSMKPGLQNIYIKAYDGNTWLSYKVDNNPVESTIINQGKDLYLQGQEIRVFLGNVNVTKIFYNNYLIDTPTKSGVKSLVFPEESNQKFELPLFPKANDDILYTSQEYRKRMELEEKELRRQGLLN